MPDNQTLGIDVKITRSGTGAQDAARELRDVTGQTGKLSDTQNDASKSAEKLEVNHRALLRLLGLLGPAGQEFGHALLGLGEGPVGVMLALGIAVKLAADYFEDLNKTAEEAAKPFEGFEKVADVYRDIAKSTQSIVDNVSLYVTQQEQLNKQLAIEREERTTIARLQGNVEAARRAEEEAGINAQVAAGTMTPAKAAALKAGIDQQAKIDEQNRISAEAQAKSADLKKQYDTAFANAPGAGRAADEAQKALDQFKLDQAHYAKENLPELLKKQKELEDKIEAAKDTLSRGGFFDRRGAFTEMTPEQRSAWEDHLKTLQGNYAGIGNTIDRYNYFKSPQIGADEKFLQDRATTTAKEWDDIQKALRDLPAQMMAAFNESRHTTKAGDKILDSEAAANLLNLLTQLRGTNFNKPGEPQVTGGMLADYLSAVDIRANGGKLNAAQQQAIRVIADLERNHLSFYSQIYQLIQSLSHHVGDHTAQLGDIYTFFGSH